MQKLRRVVWFIDTSGKPVPVGELLLEEIGACHFRYTQKALERKIILDPLNLPPKQGIFRGRELGPPLLVFDDTLPDAWGLAILSRKHKTDFSRQRFLAVGLSDSSMVGGILYSNDFKTPPRPPTWIPWKTLSECFSEVRSFEIRKARALFRYLGVTGTSAGGARPKVTVVDEKGWPWLVKFPSVNDPTPQTMALVEGAGLEFAQKIGLPVPEHKVVSLGRAKALAVKRFDIKTLAPPYHGRCVLISFSTLLGGLHKVEEGYEKAGAVLRRKSSQPETDTLNFFRWALVNVAIINTDDHLKNFSLLWDGKTLRLSPAYDLVGNLWGMSEHSMPILGKTDNLTRNDLLELAKRLGISSNIAKAEIDKADEALNDYLDALSKYPGTDALVRAIETRRTNSGSKRGFRYVCSPSP